MALALTDCGMPQWPKASEENCKLVNVTRMANPSWRADSKQFCNSTPRTAQLVEPLEWLALPHGKRVVFHREAANAQRMGYMPNPRDWLSINP
nr:entry exclusion lipoprotein TrbK [Acidovorax sp. D4N7]